MRYRCPACQRSFDEPGFCPFDRTQLASAAVAPDHPTVMSVAMPVAEPTPTEQPPHATEVELRRSTLPLTPSSTQEVTKTRVPPAQETTGAKVRAVSASASEADAFRAYDAPRTGEYDQLVGQTLDGKYHVTKKIGEGGMGVVFLARHAVIERPLAIKVLKREVMRDTATIRRFVQEAKAASRIGHPNIVDVTDFGTTPDGMTYSVMEYVVGQTLGAEMRAHGPFTPLRAIKIAAQIARALGAAHDKGVIHRDLKPENVFLVDRDGRTDFVKIVDFGIAKVSPAAGSAAEPRLTRAGSVFGTPEYMAPEQAAGRGDTDGRVDVYALGVILYEMICGRVPHRGDSTVRTLAMQMLDAPMLPSKVRPDLTIPNELEQVVMTSLAKKREDRYQTMGQFLDSLERVLTIVGQSITGSPVFALSPLPPGADPAAVALPPTITPDNGPAAGQPPAGSPTTRRLKNEPEFVASTDAKPLTFEHVWTESDLPSARRRWPVLLLFALILGGAAGAIALVMKSRSAVTDTPYDAAIVAVIGDAAPDAAIVNELVDAGVDDAPEVTDVRPDAGHVIVVVPIDAGRHRPPRRDAGVAVIRPPDTANGRGTVMVQVITKPEGATLYVGHSYRGPGGATLEEPLGTRLEVRCSQKGYKDGHVQLRFDGNTEVVLCVLQRIKICINNIKNPFDDCELDPTKP